LALYCERSHGVRLCTSTTWLYSLRDIV